MSKKLSLDDLDPEEYRVNEEDLPSNFGETIGKMAVNMYLNPLLLVHAEGTIRGLEFRAAEAEQSLKEFIRFVEVVAEMLERVLPYLALNPALSSNVSELLRILKEN